jgi:hypothetical protein
MHFSLLRDNLKDVDGLRLNPKVVKKDCKFCCNKHEHESTERKKQFVEQRRLNNIYQLDNYIASADTYKNGYIPRDVLTAFIVESVHSNFHKPITNVSLLLLLLLLLFFFLIIKLQIQKG